MDDIHIALRVLILAAAAAAAGVGILFWIRLLNSIVRDETDPNERRKWFLRVLFLRFIGVIWYMQHRRKSASGDVTDESPPPGSP